MTRKQSIESLPDEVLETLKTLVPPKSKILLAVSGGSDSTGLLHLTALAAPHMDLKLTVGFVNHGLRGGVDKELDLVKSHAQKLGLPVRAVSIAKDEAKRAQAQGSVQAWAREMRYKLLMDTAKTLGMDFIATGHTMDDQSETLLLRIIRGTGLDGLAGIAPKRPLGAGISVIRPLLGLSRLDIRQWLGSNGIGWAEDPSNMDSRFLRVRVRNEILPVMTSMQPGVSSRIAALAQDARSAAEIIELASSIKGEVIKNLNLSAGVKLDGVIIRDLPDYMQTRLIRSAIRRVRCDLQRIERSHIEFIQKLIRARKTSGPLPLPGEAAVYMDKGSLFAFPGPLPARPLEEKEVVLSRRGLWRVGSETLGVTAKIRSDDRSRVESLVLRTRQPGDKVWRSKTKLKELLIEKAVPRIYRNYVPLLAREDRIVSIPGLLEKRDPKIQVLWEIARSSPMLDIGLDEQHS